MSRQGPSSIWARKSNINLPGTALPLAPGDSGNGVADLQASLAALGIDALPDPQGEFGPGTRAAVEAFQHLRGSTGRRDLWNTDLGCPGRSRLRLGDRFLYRRGSMFRGDDVAELQRRLSALGFDTGRVDGIFGDRTALALGEFQRNLGLPVDGILGAETLSELQRVMPRRELSDLVSAVRDSDRLRHLPKTLLGRRIAVGEEGGLDALASAVRRGLHRSGANAISVLHPDGSAQAAAANAAGAEVYLGLRFDPRIARCSTSHYSGYRYESTGGRRFAEIPPREGPRGARTSGERAGRDDASGAPRDPHAGSRMRARARLTGGGAHPGDRPRTRRSPYRMGHDVRGLIGLKSRPATLHGN